MKTPSPLRWAIIALAAALLAAVLAPPAPAQTQRALRYEELVWPWSCDPVTAKSNAQKRIAQLLFSGITKEVGKETYRADLYEATNDSPLPFATDEGYTIVIRLRPGVRWVKDPNPEASDEAPEFQREINIADIISTLRAVLNENTKNYACPELAEYIKYAQGEVDYVQSGAELRLRLIRAAGASVARLMSFKVLPALVLDKSRNVIVPGSPAGQPETMLTSGPYWLDQRKSRERRLIFKAVREYHFGAPRIREIQMSFVPDPVLIAISLEGDQSDLAPEIPYSAVEHLLDQPDKFTGRDYASFNFVFVGGNYRSTNPAKQKYIRDIRFREALDLATSDALRREMIKKGYKGEGAPIRDFFGPNAPYAEAALPEDTSTAAEREARVRRLLEECGYADNPVTFELKYMESAHSKSAEGMADLFVENAARCGIRMVKQGVRTSPAVDRWRAVINTKREFDFILDTYVYGESYDLEPFFQGDENVLSYAAGDALAAAFAEFRKLKSPTAHWNDLREIVRLLLKDHAVVCIGSLKTTSIWRTRVNVPKEKITSEYFFNDVQEWQWAR